MANNRNVLFLIADDWSPLAACYGNDVVRTPNIDALAQRGTIFDYGFCTSPSCAVSRACILTGHYSHTHGQYGHCHGIHGFRTHEHMCTLPAVLRDNGFATGTIGKRHFAPASVYPFESVCEQPDVNPRHPFEMADAARDFLKQNPDRPFYLHMGFTDPHRSPGGFGNETPYEGVEEQTYSPAEVVVPRWLPDIPAVREDLADYYQAVSRFDLGIGEAVRALDESGRLEQTLIVITSDHGMPFTGAKASSFDSGHRCPLIIIDPTQERQGLHNQALVNWQDFMPTFLDWMGLEGADDLPGRSLLPILEDERPVGWEDTWFSHNFHEVTNYYPYRVLRQRRWKYVLNLAHQLPMPIPSDLFRSPTWQGVLEGQLQELGDRSYQRTIMHDHEELYDMENDPHETRNLIHHADHAERVKAMRKKMTSWRVETRDPWLEVSFQQGEVGEDSRRQALR